MTEESLALALQRYESRESFSPLRIRERESMNRNFKTNTLYFYMAIVGAAMVPVMANAQQADNGDGPRVVYYDEETQPAGPVTSGNGSEGNAAAPAAASGQSGAAA